MSPVGVHSAFKGPSLFFFCFPCVLFSTHNFPHFITVSFFPPVCLLIVSLSAIPNIFMLLVHCHERALYFKSTPTFYSFHFVHETFFFFTFCKNKKDGTLLFDPYYL